MEESKEENLLPGDTYRNNPNLNTSNDLPLNNNN